MVVSGNSVAILLIKIHVSYIKIVYSSFSLSHRGDTKRWSLTLIYYIVNMEWMGGFLWALNVPSSFEKGGIRNHCGRKMVIYIIYAVL